MSFCPAPTAEYLKLESEFGSTVSFKVWESMNFDVSNYDTARRIAQMFTSQHEQVKALNDKDKVGDIKESLRNPKIELRGRDYVRLSNQQRVERRVSDIIRQFNIEVQGFRGDTVPDEIYQLKGTAVHSWLRHILEANKEGKKATFSEIKDVVVKELLSTEKFKGKTESYVTVSPSQFLQLQQAMTSLVDQIKDTQNMIDPEGKFELFIEVPILDDVRDMGGTVDLLAVYSDGTASIFDFKTYGGKAKTAPANYKVDYWQIQLANYRNMLRENYGVKDFRHSRVIPMQVQWDESKAGFGFVSVQTPANMHVTGHLNPVPLQELTGDEKLDGLLKDLMSQIDHIQTLERRAAGAQKYNLIRRLGRLRAAVADIQLRRDIKGTQDSISNLIKYINDRIHLNSDNEQHLDMGELSDLYQELKVYSTIATDYESVLANRDIPTDEKAKVKMNLSLLQTEIGGTMNSIMDKILSNLPDDIRNAGNVPGSVGRLFKGLGEYNMPIFRELNKLFRKQRELTFRRTMSDIDKIVEVDKGFREWADKNGVSQIAKFDMLYDSERGELVGQYSKDFWKRYGTIKEKLQKNEKLNADDRKWLLDKFELDTDRVQKERTSVFKSIDDEVAANQITPAEATRRKEAWASLRDFKGMNIVSRQQLKYLKAKSSDPADLNPKWMEIQKHEAVKKYYDMYIDFNLKAGEMVGWDKMGRHFVANVQQDVVDRLMEVGPGGIFDIGLTLDRAFALRQEDETFGVRDPQGNFIRTIPLLYSDPIRKPLRDSEKADIEAEVALIITDKNSQEYKSEVERRIAKKEFEIGRTIKSKDLTKSLMLMTAAVNQHQDLTSIEGTVKSLQLLVHEDSVTSKNLTITGKAALNKFTADASKRIGMSGDLSSTFDKFVDMFLYGKQFDSDFALGKYSGNKVIRSMMSWFSLRSLGLNFILIATNYIQARGAFHMKAAEDLHFGKSDLKLAMDSFNPLTKDSKWNLLSELIMPATRDLVRERIDLSGATWGSKYLTQRTAYIGHIKGDNNVDNMIAVAMSKRYVLDSDGKIKNPKTHTLINKDAKSIYDLVQSSDGKAVVEGLSLEELANYRAKVQKIAFGIKGTLNEEQKGLYSTTLVGSLLMHFRSWIPGLFQERFSSMRFDETLETVEVGRFRVAVGEIIGQGLLPSIAEVVKISGEIASFGLYRKQMNMDAVNRGMQRFIEENPEYRGKITPEQYIQLRRAKLNAFVAETRLYLGFIILLQMLGGLEWDDEDEAGMFAWNTHNIARRALLEVSFWYSPSSAGEIIRSPLPMAGALTEIGKLLSNAVVETSYVVKGERNAQDKTPPFYYTLKNTPILNQVLKINGYFNEYNPKKSLWDKVMEDEE